jgi:hypothetical protein
VPLLSLPAIQQFRIFRLIYRMQKPQRDEKELPDIFDITAMSQAQKPFNFLLIHGA